MATSVYGVESFEYAPISADGSLPTVGWKKISPISDDAVTLTIPVASTNDIRAQDIAGIYESLPGDTEPATMEVSTLDVNGEQAAELLGGEWDSEEQTYDAPTGDEIKKFAVRLTSKPLNGKKVQFHFRKSTVLSNINAQFVRNDLVRIGFTAKATTPLNASGVPQSPWGFKIIDIPAA